MEGKEHAKETPVGLIPTHDAITLDGLSISHAAMEELLHVDHADWRKEHAEVGRFFERFGKHLPVEIRDEHEALKGRLQHVAVAPK